MTPDQLQCASGCAPAVASVWAPILTRAAADWGVATPVRIAGWVSQMAHESGRFTTLQESLNYSATALVALFGRHRISVADAEHYGRTTSHAADQAALANLLYGGEWGRVNLGNTKLGDGWKFRGRGLKQVTGAANYAACGAALGLPLLENPDLLLLPEHAASSAGWFWASRRMNALADARDVVAMTKAVNGGSNGLVERTALFKSACLAFGV